MSHDKRVSGFKPIGPTLPEEAGSLVGIGRGIDFMIACCENGPYILEDGKWKKLNAPKATDSAGH